MPWHLHLHADAPIVEIVYVGQLHKAALQAASQATLVVAQQQHRLLLLSDCTALEGGHTIGDLYFLAQDRARNSRSFLLKEAVVCSPLIRVRDLATFWQTAASNWGFQVRCFDQRQAAIAWLLQD